MLDWSSIMVSMNRLANEDRTRILACLVEGNSIRSTCRMTGFAKGTVLKFVAEIGEACEAFHDERVRGVNSKRIQADEIWSFCYAKDKNLPDHMRGQDGVGSVWTWTAIDSDTKLMVSWHVGSRDADSARWFMQDLASRLAGRVQLTTDGHHVYERAVESAFGWNVDYAQLVKVYGNPREGENRYSPGVCLGADKNSIIGRPSLGHVSTSHVERSNLTMRMGMRRFTRLTNAFSKKFANTRAAVALHFVHYNFCRVHKTLRVTPAMEAGLANHVWELSEIVALLEQRENAVVGTVANKRGPYTRSN